MPHNSHFHKRYLILNLINHLGPISRTELINITDYRPATVTDITKELLDEQLLVETGNYSTGHGRRRTLLEINKEHLCGAGIAFSPDSVTLILSQFDGTILRQDKFSFLPEVPKEELIEEIAAHTQALISDLGDREILGIGIGSSICCNGMAVGGANGVAGELGHMVIDYASPSSIWAW